MKNRNGSKRTERTYLFICKKENLMETEFHVDTF